MLPDDPREHRLGLRGPVRQGAGVLGGIQGGADVVAHAPIDRNVGARTPVLQLHGLHRPDLVQGNPSWATDSTSGFDAELGAFQSETSTLVIEDVLEGLSKGVGWHG